MEYSHRCESCKRLMDDFDSVFFRGFQLCDGCFNDDDVIRSCMELFYAKKNYPRMYGSSENTEKLLAQLQEICFAAAREKRDREVQLSKFI